MKAPDFNLKDSEGNSHSLKDYIGRWLVIYFYPKDATPGCTKEACSFRDSAEEIEELGAQVVGISADSESSHQLFSVKHHLNFPILSDPSKEIITAYGAIGIKKMFGKEFTGILRQTVIIDPDGNIVKRYEKVNPAIHTKEVLKDLAELQK